jgi:signal transduction histidine kinase/ligand-binding sensor domain-containing protein/CheY-like chemotaxis protein/HPt (histidine-containing phosphotransfer) domain-containing protein
VISGRPFPSCRITLLAILIGLCIPLAVSAQADAGDLRFERITVNDGLLNSNVSAIVQDHQGYIWFGTVYGLNRYDGYEFREYTYEPFETSSLPHSQIQSMYLDDEGYIWIGTYGGLSRLDPATEKFTNFLHDPDDPTSLSDPLVMSILKDSRGRLWVGTNDGVSMSEDGGVSFQRFPADPGNPRSLGNKTVRAIHQAADGSIWLGHYNGISRFDEDRGDFNNIFWGGVSVDEGSGDAIRARREAAVADGALPGTYVMSFASDRDGRLFAGMWEGHISRYDAATDSFVSWTLPTEGVYQLLFDANNTLWIATWTGGLFAMDAETGEYQRYTNQSGNRYSLSNDLVYSLMEDEGGILWVGTRGGGINKYDPKKNSFAVYQHEENRNSISPGDYNVLLEDSRGMLWLGTYTNGLDLIDRETRFITHYRYRPEDPDSINDNYVRNAYEDRENRLWILTNSGLNRYDYENDRFIHMGEPFEERILNTMIQDTDGNFWFGTYNNGVIVADPDMRDFRFYTHNKSDPSSLSNNLVSVIFQDSAGSIWLGTNGGLDRWNGRGFEHFRYNPEDTSSISGNKITVIVEDDFGQLWIGTNSGGLNLYDRATREFTHFTTRNGLPSNYVAAVVQDDQKRMWISTSRGLVILDPKLKDFVIIDEDDGLVSWEMNPAAIRTRDGTLYISSDGGIHRIESISYVNNRHKPPVVISEVLISGESYPILTEEEAVLDFQDNFLSFSFAALDYTAPSKNLFQYRLQGLDSEWSQPGRENRAVYSDLPPGRYLFEVKGANNDGVWNEEPARYSFVIRPPWYLSPPAIALEIIFLILFLFTIFNFFRIRWQLSQQELREETRINRLLERKVMERTQALSDARRRAEDADAAKSRFLANISHDIRTPLNSIIGFSEMFRRSPDAANSRRYAETIYTESKKLLDLINEILDMSKIEAGKHNAELVTFDLRRFIDSLTSSYRQSAANKGLVFNLDLSADLPEQIVSDRLSLARVLENLLGNALKFTTVGFIGLRVELRTGDGRSRIRFTVEDSGIGIPEEKQKLIFRSFEQLDKSLNRSYSGSGLGMAIASQLVKILGGEGIDVESRPGDGSRFSFDIPLDQGDPRPEYEGDDDAPSQLDLSTARILLVEDYEPNQEIIKALLEDTGAAIVTADRGERAIELMKTERFELVIMDLHMPGMDGLETTREIRKRDAAVPILGVTADVVQESRENCLRAGMNDVINKPVRQNLLLRSIASLLSSDGQLTAETAPAEEWMSGANPVIDFDALMIEHDQQIDVIVALAEGFIVASREAGRRIAEGVESGAVKDVHRLCHSIKGGALNLMALRISRLAGDMEERAKSLLNTGSEFAEVAAGEFSTMLDELYASIDELEAVVRARSDSMRNTEPGTE